MRREEARIVNACQIFLAAMALGIGLVLTLPGDTFAISLTFQVLRTFPLTEDQWGLVFTGLGVACGISVYFSRLLFVRHGDDQFGGRIMRALYRLLRMTWFISTPIWFFWAGCYLAATPISIGTVCFTGFGCLSLYVHSRVRKEARENGG